MIVSQLTGGAAPEPYQGAAICYIEVGGEQVARVDVNFLSGDGPTALFKAPSAEFADEKRQFAATRRARWFGEEVER